MTNPQAHELRENLERFIRYRGEHLSGDEKGEAQLFLENLFKAFGHEGLRQAGATLEMRVTRHDNRGTAYADLVWKPRVLIEMKKAGRDLRQDYRQVFEYWIDLVPDRPQYVVLCNFDEFWVYDLNRQLEEPVDRIAVDDLARRWDAFTFLLPTAEEPTFGNDLVAVTRETAAMVSGIFNRLVERGVDRDAAQQFIFQALMAASRRALSSTSMPTTSSLPSRWRRPWSRICAMPSCPTGRRMRRARRHGTVCSWRPTLARVNWHKRKFLERWWQLGWRRGEMIAELKKLDRYIALSRVAVASRQSPYVCVLGHLSLGCAAGLCLRRRLQLRHSALDVPPDVFRGALLE